MELTSRMCHWWFRAPRASAPRGWTRGDWGESERVPSRARPQRLRSVKIRPREDRKGSWARLQCPGHTDSKLLPLGCWWCCCSEAVGGGVYVVSPSSCQTCRISPSVAFPAWHGFVHVVRCSYRRGKADGRCLAFRSSERYFFLWPSCYTLFWRGESCTFCNTVFFVLFWRGEATRSVTVFFMLFWQSEATRSITVFFMLFWRGEATRFVTALLCSLCCFWLSGSYFLLLFYAV